MTFLDADNAIAVVRGATRSFALRVANDDGTPVNLTDARILCTVKARKSDEQPVIRKDSQAMGSPPAFTRTGADDRTGVVTLNLYPRDTHNLEPGVYPYDVWVLFGDGRRVPVIPESTLEILDSITRVPLT